MSPPLPEVAKEISTATANFPILTAHVSTHSMHALKSFHDIHEEPESTQDCYSVSAHDMKLFKDPKHRWRCHFDGFVSLNQPEFELRSNRKCMELPPNVTDYEIDKYLSLGIRCFIIDLFYGNEETNIKRVKQLRMRGAHMMRNRKIPVSTTIIGKLTPRHHYTGQLTKPDACYYLEKGHQMALTTSRYFSLNSSVEQVYINAGHVLQNLQPFDIVLLGLELQFLVQHTEERWVYGEVIRAGTLRSRMPVRFPTKRVNYTNISFEEVRDVALAKELNLNMVLVSTFGNEEYFRELREAVNLVDGEHMRLLTVFKPNILQEPGDQYDWLLDICDGFVIQFEPINSNSTRQRPELLKLCPIVSKLLTRIYESTKPILLDPTYLLERSLLPQEQHYRHIFYEPDKFIITPATIDRAHCFDMLTEQYMIAAVRYELSQPPCDPSYTCIKSLAKALSAAAYEVNAAVIILHAEHDAMASLISNFRINLPIVLVTPISIICAYMSVYFNVLCVHVPFDRTAPRNALTTQAEHAYEIKNNPTYHQRVAISFMSALDCASQMKLIRDNRKAILVYSMRGDTQLPDKYVIYNFKEQRQHQELQKQLFNCTCVEGKCIEQYRAAEALELVATESNITMTSRAK